MVAAEDYIPIPGAGCAFPKADQWRIDRLIRDIHSGSLTLPDSALVADIVAAYRHIINAPPAARRLIIAQLGGEVDQ
jgi:hypothetical protein